MATVEIAVALPSLVLITALALWGVLVASVQLTCVDAARTGARAAARGESLTAVHALIAEAVPTGASVRVRRDAATVQVDISAPVQAPAAAGLPPMTIHAHATAATEPGALDDPNTQARPNTRPTSHPQQEGAPMAANVLTTRPDTAPSPTATR
ncbi:TadE family type IV pilus minor pilin [Actinomadura terrae]|uniref:TadE family type IV pilus minor pilin n=1 Tax=Actinomadura terrae TaxID=604353 RepID=UPI001FA6E9AC|nr:TadE family type IV pilus minor pilin [Actinomadura terrae]